LKGTRLFAPSSVIEDLRLQCLLRHRWVYEAFVDLDVDRSTPLTLDEFTEMLSKLRLLDWIDVEAIFDLLDVSNEGSATLGNLVAALQAGGPGSSVKLQEEGLRAHAKQDVRKCISSAHTLVGDLKTQVRQGVRFPEANRSPLSPAISEDESASEAETDKMKRNFRATSQRGKRSRPTSALRGSQATGPSAGSRPGTSLGGTDGPAASSSRPGTSLADGPAASSSSRPGTSLGASASGKDLHERRAGLSSQSGLQPRLRTFPHQELKNFVRVQTPSRGARPGTSTPSAPQLPSHRTVNDNQQSWGSIWNHFKRCTGQEDRAGLEKDVQAYYQNATWRLSHDVPILKQSHSRFDLHRNARTHYQKIASLGRRNQTKEQE